MAREREDRSQDPQASRKIKKRKKKRRIRWRRAVFLLFMLAGLILLTMGGLSLIFGGGLNSIGKNWIPGFAKSPSEVLENYMDLLAEGRYAEMYQLLSEETRNQLTEDTFTQRNQRIYEGIDAENIQVTIGENAEKAMVEKGYTEVTFSMVMDTCAGELRLDSSAVFVDERGGSYLIWKDDMIFPDLEATDKVIATSSLPKRGSIYDRDGNLLAGNGTATSVGLVPGKMEEDSVQRLAEMLDLSTENIEKKLEAAWVGDTTFVPIQNIEKLSDQELSSPTERTAEKADLQEALLEIPGVMMQDTTVRVYPMGEITAHLIGYLQNISSEELEADDQGFYNSNSQIGKTGLEKTYEDQLRGQLGHRISIVKEDGNIRKVLAIANPVDGKDVTLTIDSSLQRKIYETYREVDSATVALNPKTGEVLALVNTPSFDTNLFSLGITDSQWNALNEDERKPLTNRFRSLYTPGSSMKPITAAIGMDAGLLDPEEDYGSESSWQLNAGWGNYQVTTLHAADPAILQNAMVQSDNVYFAKAASRIGTEVMAEGWERFGFNETLPFALSLMRSTYFSSEDEEMSEIQLADSGYGQGELQVNPVHMAVMYTAFVNDGDMIQPHLELSEETSIWMNPAISVESSEVLHEALCQVVSSESGTGYRAYMEDLPLAGKTGTAELKSSRSEDQSGEIGWFTSYTYDRSEEQMLLLCTMVEHVEDLGGSGYVVRGSRDIHRFYAQLDQTDEQ